MNTELQVRINTPSPNLSTFPILYKRSNTGAITVWGIIVKGSTIETSYGQLGGLLQHTSDTVLYGKNLGRQNATTAEQQAVLEAAAKWKKKIEREGYVQDLERARNGETDIEGGIAPMLAQPLEDAERHLKFPCDAQPKLNGLRCIVMIEDGRVSLWSRRRDRINGVPHVEEAYMKAFEGAKGTYILDGELYRHGWPLQRIGGYVRKKVGTKPGFEELSHFVYDVPSETGAWAERRLVLNDLGLRVLGPVEPIIQIVQTVKDIGSMSDIKALHDDYVKRGFEGAIVRNLDAPYEAGKRSPHLIKVKDFLEREFKIVAVAKGRGRMADGAIFTCVTDEGREFEVTAPGSMTEKFMYLQEPAKVIGKSVTVRFQEWSEKKMPLQPRSISVRDYE